MNGRKRPGPASRHAAGSQGGFTLVELLVSLVILGFVMSLVSEAIYQVAQIARAADASSRALSARWGAGWSASSLFANLLAPGLPKEEPVLTGDPTRVSGYTSLPLDGGNTGIARFQLELQPDPDAPEQTRLAALPLSAAPGAGKPATVAAFKGRAEFAFVDRQGTTLNDWPPSTRTGLDPEDLPKAVIVRDAATGQTLMWYPFPGETARPTPATVPIGVLPK